MTSTPDPALRPVVLRPADRRRTLGAVLLVLALAAVALLYLRPDPFADQMTVRAVVDDATGLAPVGAEVRVAGTKVGEVTGRRRIGDDAELELRVDREVGEVHADATAALRPRLAFEGTAYVDLTTGHAAAGALRGAIPKAHTSTYVSLADVLRILGKDRSRALQGTLAGLRDTLTTAETRSDPDRGGRIGSRLDGGGGAGALGHVIDRAPRLTATLARTARAARAARPGGDALRTAVTHLSATTRAVAARDADLAPLADDLGTTARALDDPALDATLRRLPGTAATVRAGATTLRGTVRTLRPLAADLRPAARALDPALTTARPLLREAAGALTRATPLLTDLRATLDRTRAAAPATRRVLHSLDPTLATLQDSTLAALERRTTLGTPAYLAFLGLFAGGGGASSAFDGQGHFMRFGFRFLTGLGQPLPPCSLLKSAAPALGEAFAKAGGCTP